MLDIDPNERESNRDRETKKNSIRRDMESKRDGMRNDDEVNEQERKRKRE